VLDIEAQQILLIALYRLDNESPGSSFLLEDVAKNAGLRDMIDRLIETTVFQLKNKGFIVITLSGPYIMITPDGREAAEQIILTMQDESKKGKIGFKKA
jgi:hypothetical protein